MGKETKIGVSVIVILLCVLAGVVAMRFTRSKEKNLVAAVTAPEAPRPAPKPEPPPRPSPTTLLPTGGASKPTSGWSMASDTSSRPTALPIAPPTRPEPPAASFMPDPSLAGSRPAMHHHREGRSPLGATLAAPIAPSAPPGMAADLSRPSAFPGAAPRPSDPSPLGGASTLNIAVAQSDPPPPPAGLGPRHGGGPYGRMSPPLTYASGRHDYGRPSEPPPAIRTAAIPVANPVPERRPIERVQPGGSYKVVPGDNYWKISEKLYGSGAYFKALAEHNRDRNLRDDRLQPGAVIAAPETAELEKKYAGLCPKASHQQPTASRIAQVSSSGRLAGRRSYKVESGDTLYDIAKHELGNPGRWGEIYQLNREVLGDDYDYLPRGLELALPDGPRRDTLTQRPDESLRR